MGKRSEKNQNKEPQEILEEDSENKLPEPYVCTGNFHADFTELCRRNDMAVIPPVIPRPKVPNLPKEKHSHEVKADKKDKSKQSEPEELFNEDGTPIEPPPKTYIMKDSFEYFKPCVQVETEHADRQDFVTEVFVRGWKIDEPMMNIFKQCLPLLEKLHTIKLWHVGLTREMVNILAEFLPDCLHITTLILDGNNLKEENWHKLIGERSIIKTLSLRNCSITDKGAEGIGKALGRARKPNSKLVSLDLSRNCITDIGCIHIANGLNMNRILLVLSLAGNQIEDRGCCKLAEAISRFPLTHEEVIERRRQMSDKLSPVRIELPVGTHARHKDKVKRIVVKQKKDSKGEDNRRKDEKLSKKDARQSKDNTNTFALGKKNKGSVSTSSIITDSRIPSAKGKDRKRDRKMFQTSEVSNETKLINPLLEDAEHINGELWVAGNRVMISLNLFRNQITIIGVEAMLKAIIYQTIITQDNKDCGTGLMRLNMNRNNVDPHHFMMLKLVEIMKTKDPYQEADSSHAADGVGVVNNTGSSTT